MMRQRGGFTFVEILTVMIIIGLLATIAVPHYSALKKKAVAGAIFQDVHTVHVAAMQNYVDANGFPPDSPDGSIPPELVPHLPRNFSFVHKEYTYGWAAWSSGTGNLVGVRVSSGDSELLGYVAKVAGPGFVPIFSGSRVTFLLSAD